MKYLLLIFSLLPICSFKNQSDTQLFIDSLKNSNEFLSEFQENRMRMIYMVSRSDPREQTQNIILNIELLNDSVREITDQIYLEKGCDGRFLYNAKKQLIDKFINYSKEEYIKKYLNDSLLLYKNIHPVVAENQLLLLKCEVTDYFTSMINAYDFRVELPRAVFKVDSNKYLAIFSVKPPSSVGPALKVKNMKHKGVQLKPNEYKLMVKEGISAVLITPSDTTVNKLGGYIFEYSVKWPQQDIGVESGYLMENGFMIEE